MGRRVGDAGRSEGHPVMGWRGVEPAQHHSTRTRADFPCGSCLTRDFGKPTSGDTADDSRGNTSWCGLPPGGRRACPQVAQGSQPCASAPSASREGATGRQMGEGASPSTSADPLVLCQDAGGQTGDGKPRPEDPWGANLAKTSFTPVRK